MARPDKGFTVQGGDKLEIWTDGACSGNPGGGGYAALLKNNGHVKEIAGGFAHTTNNRMRSRRRLPLWSRWTSRVILQFTATLNILVDAVSLGWARSGRPTLDAH